MKKKILFIVLIMLIPVLFTACKDDINEPQEWEEEVIDFLYAKHKDYGDIVIKEGNIVDNLMEGFNMIEVENDDKRIHMIGTFEKGEMVEGIIEIEYKDGSKKIKQAGHLERGKLNGEGRSEIVINDYKLIREGVFKDNKLNGLGRKELLENNKIIQKAEGLYEDDIIK